MAGPLAVTRPPFFPFFPFFPLRFMPPPICCIICRICLNWVMSWETSDAEVPDPFAIRVRREPSMMSGFVALLAGHRADDRLDPVDLTVLDLDVAHLLGDARHHAHEPRRAVPSS